jgi:hypothetical protein
LKNLITYDFGFLISIRNLKPPTPTLGERKIVGVDGGVDFPFKQHYMPTNVVSVGSVHSSSISMFFSMSYVNVKKEAIVFASMTTS